MYVRRCCWWRCPLRLWAELARLVYLPSLHAVLARATLLVALAVCRCFCLHDSLIGSLRRLSCIGYQNFCIGGCAPRAHACASFLCCPAIAIRVCSLCRPTARSRYGWLPPFPAAIVGHRTRAPLIADHGRHTSSLHLAVVTRHRSLWGCLSPLRATLAAVVCRGWSHLARAVVVHRRSSLLPLAGIVCGCGHTHNQANHNKTSKTQ